MEARKAQPRAKSLSLVLRHLLRGNHVCAAIVAAACVGVALSNGGYAIEFRAAATIIVWWAVIIGITLGGWPRAPIPRVALTAGVSLAGLALLTLLSLTWAADDGRVFAEVVRVAGYLGLFALVVVASPAASARWWLTGLAMGLLVVSILALGSRLQPELFPSNQLASFLPNTRARLSYPLGYWNGLAAVLAMAFVALVGFGGTARGAGLRAAAVAAAPVPAFALFLTSSRGGILAATVGLLVLIGLGPARGRLVLSTALAGAGGLILGALATQGPDLVDGQTGTSSARIQGDEMLVITIAVVALVGLVRYALDPAAGRLRPVRALRIASVVVLAAAVLGSVAASNPAQRLHDLTQPPASTPDRQRGLVASHLASAQGTGRAQFWESAWDAFTSKPIGGIGAGGYEAWWAEHGSVPLYVRDAHSLFLETLGELGVPGLTLLVMFLVSGFAAARRRMPRGADTAPLTIGVALLACGVVSAALDWTWELPAAFGPVVLAVALLTGPATSLAGSRSQRTPGGYGWGAATLGVGWACIVAATLVLVSEIQLSESREAARASDLDRAARTAEAAATVQPWAAAPRLQEALVSELRGDLSGALAANAEAIKRAENDWRLWLTEVRLRAKAGDVPASRRALRRARALNPRSALFSALP